MVKFLGFTLLVLLVSSVHVGAQEDSLIIDEIQVSANIFEGKLMSVAGGMSVLNENELSKHDQVSISSQLNTLPGVFMHSGTFNTNRVVIRGIGSRTPYSSNRIKAYLNDIPLTNGDGVSTIEDVDVERLERIEVIKGPSAALYGAGLGGVINMRLASPDKKAVGRFQYGSFDTQLASVQLGMSTLSGGLSFHNTRSEGYRENNHYNRSSILFNGSKKWRKNEVSFTLVGGLMNAQIPSSLNKDMFINTPEKAAPNWKETQGFEENAKLTVGASFKRNINETMSNKLTLFGGLTNSFEHRPFNDLDDRSVWGGFSEKMRFNQGNLALVAGAEVFLEKYFWETSKNENIINQIDEFRWNGNFSTLAKYQFGQLNLSGGFNLGLFGYQYNSTTEQDGFSYPLVFSPKLGVNYMLSQNIHVYGSAGHGFSPPSLEETLMPDGAKNMNLRPETGMMSEIGVRAKTHNQKLFVDALVYVINLDNLLVTKRISEENFMGVNAGKTKHVGLELQGNYVVYDRSTFPGNLNLNTSFTFSQNTFQEFIDDGVDHSGKLLPGIPKYLFNGVLSWKPSSPFNLNFVYRYVGEQYMQDSNEQTYAPYSIMNFNTTLFVAKSKWFYFELKGGVNNVLNKHYASMILVNAPSFGGSAPRYYYPGQPRNVFIAVGISTK